jgi:selenocysteine lyase/cysteine desulfurase
MAGLALHPARLWRRAPPSCGKSKKRRAHFFSHDYRGKWNSTVAYLAARLRVAADSLALVDNVTDGINAVLRAFAFKPGDEILATSMTYGAIDLAADPFSEPKSGALP